RRLDRLLHAGQGEGCVMIALAVPDLGDPEPVRIGGVFCHHVAETPGHAFHAVEQYPDQLVALARHRRDLADETVHGSASFVCRWMRLRVGNLVVTAPRELHKAWAMTEGIAQKGALALLVGTDGLLQPRARRHGLLHGPPHILDPEVQVHRGPMASYVRRWSVEPAAAVPSSLTSRYTG